MEDESDTIFDSAADVGVNSPILCARTVWESFHNTGDLQSSLRGDTNVGQKVITCTSRKRVASCLCIRKTLQPEATTKMTFSFALAWDNPIARFGSGMAVPRYYTRFFGDSGFMAPSIAAYALEHCANWEV